jgi:C1A family cysteine protease
VIIMDHIYNLKKDKYDDRDLFLTFNLTTQLPQSVDLSNILPPPFQQGNLGSCTACTGTEMIECLENKAKVEYVPLSKLFLYFNERLLINSVNEDSGSSIRDICRATAKFGCCPEEDCPYIIEKFTEKPSDIAYKNAEKYKAIQYMRLSGTTGLMANLASGYPAMIGIAVYESFEKDIVSVTGNVPLPKRREQLYGYHAILITGYDTKTQKFKFLNSWGKEWGSDGSGWLPFSYVRNPALSSDFWTIRKTASF